MQSRLRKRGQKVFKVARISVSAILNFPKYISLLLGSLELHLHSKTPRTAGSSGGSENCTHASGLLYNARSKGLPSQYRIQNASLFSDQWSVFPVGWVQWAVSSQVSRNPEPTFTLRFARLSISYFHHADARGSSCSRRIVLWRVRSWKIGFQIFWAFVKKWPEIQDIPCSTFRWRKNGPIIRNSVTIWHSKVSYRSPCSIFNTIFIFQYAVHVWNS